MLSWPDIPRNSLFPLSDTLPDPDQPFPVTITVEAPNSAAPLPDFGEQAWSDLCAANPRFHDSPILAVVDSSIAISGGLYFRCVVDRFKRLAVQNEALDLGVRILSVKGLIIGRDGHGREHLLMTRRGPQTRVYQLMWELAPAGGIAPPAPSAPLPVELGRRAILHALLEEGREELGLELDPRLARPVAVAFDDQAGSVDIIIRFDWPNPVDPARPPRPAGDAEAPAPGALASNWECVDLAWLARADAPDFDARNADRIIPPMRAVLRWMNWI